MPKSAYGAIVYSKAPALLKELAYLIGDDHFRDGLRHVFERSSVWQRAVGRFGVRLGTFLGPGSQDLGVCVD